MKEWKLTALCELLSHCGAVAMGYYAAPSVEIKADASVVTLADKEIEHFLAMEFNRPDSGIYLIGEETVQEHSATYFKAALGGTCWVVDPIDGTAPYTNHIDPAWGISIAYMKRGIIQEGAFYFPAIKQLIITEGEQVWYSDSFSPGQSVMPELRPFEFKYRPLGTGGMISLSQKLTKRGKIAIDDAVLSWSGCLSSMNYLMQGYFPAYVTHLKLWDIAAGLAIISHGNYLCQIASGETLDCHITAGGCFNLDFASPQCWHLKRYAILASAPAVLRELQKSISDG